MSVQHAYVPGVGELPTQGGYTSTDSLGQQTAQNIVNLGSLISGEDQTNNLMVVEERYTPTHINTLNTFVVKSSSGFLRAIVINTVGTSITITVYNNTSASAPVVAVITPTAPVTLTFDALMTTGITVVVAGTTPGDYTVIWR